MRSEATARRWLQGGGRVSPEALGLLATLRHAIKLAQRTSTDGPATNAELLSTLQQAHKQAAEWDRRIVALGAVALNSKPR